MPSPTTPQTLWGARLRARRGELGLSQDAVAERSGVSQPTLSEYEIGTRVPIDRVKAALAAALDTDVHDLFPYDEIDEAS